MPYYYTFSSTIDAQIGHLKPMCENNVFRVAGGVGVHIAPAGGTVRHGSSRRVRDDLMNCYIFVKSLSFISCYAYSVRVQKSP